MLSYLSQLTALLEKLALKNEHLQLGFALLASAPAGIAPATAQQAGSALIDDIQRCRDIRADTDRLACFDRASAALGVARGSGDVIVLDRKKVVEQRRRQFGLNDGGSDSGVEVKELQSTIRAVVPSRVPLRFDFELANGSVWQTIDTVRAPRSGAPIKVTVAALGGYRASIDGGRSFLVKRIR